MSKSLKYRCSKCGKMAVLGRHYCTAEDREKYRAKQDYDPDADLREGYQGDEVKTLNPLPLIYTVSPYLALILVGYFIIPAIGVWTLPVTGGLALAVLLLQLRHRMPGSAASGKKDLLQLCHGDKHLAERLILAEMNRGRDIHRKTAIVNAIRRLSAGRNR